MLQRLHKADEARRRRESDWNDEAVTAAARANAQSEEDLKSCGTLLPPGRDSASSYVTTFNPHED